ncbi:unannotated protein [freshwater metagenome]|uniref:Unannotated protein n=1 Tax=freshwater metagenome TaxID=449393 RepID=A0A6J6SD47_9ZZZZ
MCDNGGKHVAASEGCARRVEVPLRVVENDRALRTTGKRNRRGEQSVVRADDHAAAPGNLDRDRTP